MVSPTYKVLRQQINNLIATFSTKKYTVEHYCEKYASDLVKHCLLERSGILSSDRTLQIIGSNILILLGQQGHLNLFIERMVTILAYEPIQLLDKLEELFD
jgi:hypothetical protein